MDEVLIAHLLSTEHCLVLELVRINSLHAHTFYNSTIVICTCVAWVIALNVFFTSLSYPRPHSQYNYTFNY